MVQLTTTNLKYTVWTNICKAKNYTLWKNVSNNVLGNVKYKTKDNVRDNLYKHLIEHTKLK